MIELTRHTARFGERLWRRGMALVVVAALYLLTAGAARSAEETYRLDNTHTRIQVQWDHLGLSRQSATFRTVEGSLRIDPAQPAEAQLDIVIDATSVDAFSEPFNSHLHGANFFATDDYPKITFVSTEIEITGAKTAQITGILELRGIKRPLRLAASLVYQGAHPLAGVKLALKDAQVLSFQAQGRLRRSAFEMGSLAPLVSDDVELTIDAEFIAQ